jgi:hypothetical protein
MESQRSPGCFDPCRAFQPRAWNCGVLMGDTMRKLGLGFQSHWGGAIWLPWER